MFHYFLESRTDSQKGFLRQRWESVYPEGLLQGTCPLLTEGWCLCNWSSQISHLCFCRGRQCVSKVLCHYSFLQTPHKQGCQLFSDKVSSCGIHLYWQTINTRSFATLQLLDGRHYLLKKWWDVQFVFDVLLRDLCQRPLALNVYHQRGFRSAQSIDAGSSPDWSWEWSHLMSAVGPELDGMGHMLYAMRRWRP